MPNPINLSNQRFGRLVAIAPRAGSKTENRRREWQCLCDCGTVHNVSTDVLRSGRAKSCGCYRRENKHCQSHGMSKTKEYWTYKNMILRCYNPKARGYQRYGGRGITVCARWLNGFENFFEDMGFKPGPLYSIDRIDNSQGYSPENCKWATRKEQAANRRPPAPFTCICPNCGHRFARQKTGNLG